MARSKLLITLIILAGLFVIFVLLYYVKDRINMDILPHRHMLFFKE